MQHIKHKLKSQRGASMLYALLVFMLCVFAGVAAITAAAANAGRYTRLEQDQQQYLSVSSAAELLRDELSGQKVELSLTLRETYEWWYEKGIDSSGNDIYTPKSRTSYAFVKEDKSLTNDPDDAFVIDPKFDASGDGLAALCGDWLKSYFVYSFFKNDVPADFFAKENSGDPKFAHADGTYKTKESTLYKSSPAADLYLTVTGADGDNAEWKDLLGTVYAHIQGNDSSGLRAELFARRGDIDVYRMAFEMNAHVERTITTTQEVQDNVAGSPDGVTADVESYGCRQTDTTVKSVITWSTDPKPAVTRILG